MSRPYNYWAWSQMKKAREQGCDSFLRVTIEQCGESVVDLSNYEEFYIPYDSTNVPHNHEWNPKALRLVRDRIDEMLKGYEEKK